MGVGYYADRSSVQVEKYAPPKYQLAINVVGVEFSDEYWRRHETYIGGPYTMGDSFTLKFRYNWDRKVISHQWGFNNKLGYSPVLKKRQRVIDEQLYLRLGI